MGAVTRDSAQLSNTGPLTCLGFSFPSCLRKSRAKEWYSENVQLICSWSERTAAGGELQIVPAASWREFPLSSVH